MRKPANPALPLLIQLRVSDRLGDAIEGWRKAASDRPNRSEAVRRLIEEGLKAQATGKLAAE